MREFFKSTRFKILLAFLAFLLGIMIYAVTKGGYSVSGASFINTITKPFRAVSNGISMKMNIILIKFPMPMSITRRISVLRLRSAN